MKKLRFLSITLVLFMTFSIFSFTSSSATNILHDDELLKFESGTAIELGMDGLTSSDGNYHIMTNTSGFVQAEFWQIDNTVFIKSTVLTQVQDHELFIADGSLDSDNSRSEAILILDDILMSSGYYKATFVEDGNYQMFFASNGIGNLSPNVMYTDNIFNFDILALPLIFDQTLTTEYDSQFRIEYSTNVVQGNNLEVSITLTSGGSGVQKLYDLYLAGVGYNDERIDLIPGTETTNHALLNETRSFTVDTSSLSTGDYSFEISRLLVEHQGVNKAIYPTLDFGDFNFKIVSGPSLTLIGDSEINLEYGDTFVDPGVNATDIEDGDLTNSVVVTGTVDDSTLGTYNLVYEVTDSDGYIDTVNRTVNIIDTEKPTITIADGAATDLDLYDTFDNPYIVTVIDNYDGDISSTVVITGTVDTTIGGDYQLRYKAYDSSGNPSDTILVTIHVHDYEAPVIALIGNSIIDVEIGSTFSDPGFSVTDNSSEDLSSSVVVTGTVDTSVLGSYTVSYDVSDNYGNAATTITRTVNVVDTTAPVIVLQGSNNIDIEIGSTFSDSGFTVTDNSSEDLNSSVVVTGTVDTSVLGSYTVSYDVSDSNGNAATTITRTVNVVDTTAPILVGPDSFIKDDSFVFNAESLLEYYTSSDNLDGDLTVEIELVSSELIGNSDIPGTYSVVIEVEDSSGNTSQKSITVQVDADLPVYLVVDDAIEIVVDSDEVLESSDFISLLISLGVIEDKVYIPTIDQDTYTENFDTEGTYDYDITLNSADSTEYIMEVDIVVRDENIVTIPGIIVVPGDGSGMTLFGQPWYIAAAAIIVIVGGGFLLFGKKK